jgi:protein-disulfide isomerase
LDAGDSAAFSSIFPGQSAQFIGQVTGWLRVFSAPIAMAKLKISGNNMSKRQEMRKRQRQKQSQNRLWVILFVTVGALLVALVLILPSLKTSNTSSIVQVTPISNEVPMKKTSMGNPDAPVKMDVWEDFQCSGCLSYTQKLEPQIIQAYVQTGKVYYTFHVYPFIDGGQGESHDAANAAMCAAAQERFWDYHAIAFANWIGENSGSFTKPRLIAFAQSIRLDMTAFNQCFQENTHSAEIQQDIDDGTKLGVPPTPAIFINGKMVVSSAGQNYIPSFDDISRVIETGIK